jgi:hypothetical protein
LLSFPEPYRSKTIAAGKSAVIWYYAIPKGHVGFLTEVANNWEDYANSWAEFTIDSWQYEGRKVDRQIATLTEPHKEDPPIIVNDRIKWLQMNDDSQARVYEVYINGQVYTKSELKHRYEAYR